MNTIYDSSTTNCIHYTLIFNTMQFVFSVLLIFRVCRVGFPSIRINFVCQKCLKANQRNPCESACVCRNCLLPQSALLLLKAHLHLLPQPLATSCISLRTTLIEHHLSACYAAPSLHRLLLDVGPWFVIDRIKLGDAHL